jgi:predicted CoA-binding protein
MRLTDQVHIDALLKSTRTIAVVGISDKPHRASHEVAHYLKDAGYRIIPVNPVVKEVLGLTCYPDLASVPEPIDMVDVFRRGEEIGPIVDAAIAVGAKSLWLQLGVINEPEAERASAAGLQVVMDRCVKIDHARMR